MNYGFIEPKLKATHYVLGGFTSLPKTILQPDGQWDKYLPLYEPQAEKYETYGCTVWGTENALEVLESRLTGIEPNYDEKYIYNTVPVRPPGADPHAVCDAIREVGLIPNRTMPDTFEAFCTPTPPSKDDLTKGGEWLKKWNFGHEWVFTNVDKKTRVQLMKQALQYSPLGVSVTAWFEEDGIYVDRGLPNTHWCMAYGYTDKIVTVGKETITETFWKVFDSYDHSLKILHPDHNIYYCKRYSLEPVVKKDSWLIELIKKVVASIRPRSKVRNCDGIYTNPTSKITP
jgi:hypothetical protein